MLQKLTKVLAGATATLCITVSLALAATPTELTCSQAVEQGCTMAKDAENKEVLVAVLGAKVGDKLLCIPREPGNLACKVTTGKRPAVNPIQGTQNPPNPR